MTSKIPFYVLVGLVLGSMLIGCTPASTSIEIMTVDDFFVAYVGKATGDFHSPTTISTEISLPDLVVTPAEENDASFSYVFKGVPGEVPDGYVIVYTNGNQGRCIWRFGSKLQMIEVKPSQYSR